MYFCLATALIAIYHWKLSVPFLRTKITWMKTFKNALYMYLPLLTNVRLSISNMTRVSFCIPVCKVSTFLCTRIVFFCY